MKTDIIVIGGGPGGYVAALEAAKLGKTVTLIEQREVGGTCLNRGCIPTKALLRAARVYRESCHSAELGIVCEGVRYDWAAMHGRVDTVTAQLRGGIESMLSRAKISLVRGRGFIEAPGIVMAEGERYEADHIIIATGSCPAMPPISGRELSGVVTSDHLLQDGGIDCKRLVIIGGGVVGVEFAQVYNDLGAQVTVIEALPRLLPTLDREISQNLAMILKKRGVEVHAAAMVNGIEKVDNGLCCHYTEKETACTVEADVVLICTGRTPNTKGLWSDGLAIAGERGFIAVDAHGETSVRGIYAIGDVVQGGIQLAHAAEAAGRNVVHGICGMRSAKDCSVIPSCIFTEPEIATAGISADDAKAAGLSVSVTKNLTSANGKSVIEGADRGFAKVVTDEATGKLLGVQLMCPHASEMIGGMTVAIANGLTAEQLETTVFPHPTVSEAIVG